MAQERRGGSLRHGQEQSGSHRSRPDPQTRSHHDNGLRLRDQPEGERAVGGSLRDTGLLCGHLPGQGAERIPGLEADHGLRRQEHARGRRLHRESNGLSHHRRHGLEGPEAAQDPRRGHGEIPAGDARKRPHPLPLHASQHVDGRGPHPLHRGGDRRSGGRVHRPLRRTGRAEEQRGGSDAEGSAPSALDVPVPSHRPQMGGPGERKGHSHSGLRFRSHVHRPVHRSRDRRPERSLRGRRAASAFLVHATLGGQSETRSRPVQAARGRRGLLPQPPRLQVCRG